MESSKHELPSPETLFAAAMYLATNYAKSGCPMLCRMIMRQLACIENYPGTNVPQSLRETCGKLRGEWERIAAQRAHKLREAASLRGEIVHQIH